MAAPTSIGTGDMRVLPPALEWAQRKDRVFVTVVLENCANPVTELKSNTLYFKGKGGTENLDHEVTVELFAEIDPEKCQKMTNNRHTLFTLMKKDKTAPYWPRLTKDKKKFHFIKTDFNRWLDEDEDHDVPDMSSDMFDLNTAMQSMQGLDKADLDGEVADDEDESDDEDLPDLQ